MRVGFIGDSEVNYSGPIIPEKFDLHKQSGWPFILENEFITAVSWFYSAGGAYSNWSVCKQVTLKSWSTDE